jgi:hypothetical protein
LMAQRQVRRMVDTQGRDGNHRAGGRVRCAHAATARRARWSSRFRSRPCTDKRLL